MKRHELEHIIRAAAATADAREIVVVGSQAILGTFPDASGVLTESTEADVFPKDDPGRSIVIDGAIGELSMFHRTFGYHAHGVDETTALLPEGWQSRLVRIESPATMGAIGWCLEPHDLAASKMLAGRGKDIAFVESMIQQHMIDVTLLEDRLKQVYRAPPELRAAAGARLARWK